MVTKDAERTKPATMGALSSSPSRPRTAATSHLEREVLQLRRLCRGLAQDKVCLARMANAGPGCPQCAAMEEKVRMLLWQRDEVPASELVDGSPPVGGRAEKPHACVKREGQVVCTEIKQSIS